ncbi:SUF system NifU family Fe-S cluster assembly protein [Acetobacter sp. AN02]|uniref:Fe-S cluster assembly sulfur transfer protein SufU n=1 Tax=Acetobacter sp. AN02 TaxID=2894186 RepID=UPI0024341BAC|nr:SUF system NifU family Fe-S cluster assembly protein [Acetobacter sp. AN02]MDG6094850.1 SUF system NifU family Fe-S cluster assembly protein [Acetobacter sp. AN02]
METDGLYSDLIISRAKSPLYAGDLADVTVRGEGRNPVCGDRVRLSLKCEGLRIDALAHQTRGCAVCIASADLLAGLVTGWNRDEALAAGQVFTDMFSDGTVPAADDMPDAFRVFFPLRQHRARIGCATLPWTALKEALSDARS